MSLLTPDRMRVSGDLWNPASDSFKSHGAIGGACSRISLRDLRVVSIITCGPLTRSSRGNDRAESMVMAMAVYLFDAAACPTRSSARLRNRPIPVSAVTTRAIAPFT